MAQSLVCFVGTQPHSLWRVLYGCQCTVPTELISCNRDCVTTNLEIFPIWPFTEKVSWPLVEGAIHSKNGEAAFHAVGITGAKTVEWKKKSYGILKELHECQVARGEVGGDSGNQVILSWASEAGVNGLDLKFLLLQKTSGWFLRGECHDLIYCSEN